MSDLPRLKILDIGSGVKGGTAQIVFQDIIDQGYEYDIETLDINPDANPTYLLDLRNPFPEEIKGRFDLVLASHILEHIERVYAMIAFQNMVNAVAPGGELWVIVPSLDWCAEEIYVHHRFGLPVMACLYGDGHSNEMAHYSGYTLDVLRYMMRKAGMVEKRAFLSKFNITNTGLDGEVKVYEALQNVVIGGKPKDEGDTK